LLKCKTKGKGLRQHRRLRETPRAEAEAKDKHDDQIARWGRSRHEGYRKFSHQLAALNDALRTLVRRTHAKRSPRPRSGQSKCEIGGGHGGPVGYDAAKRIKGRRRASPGGYVGAGARRGRDPGQHHRTRRHPVAFGPRPELVHLAAILWVDGGYTGEPSLNGSKACAPSWRSRWLSECKRRGQL